MPARRRTDCYLCTITTPDDVFQKVLESAARSFRAHGFRHIGLLGDYSSDRLRPGREGNRADGDPTAPPTNWAGPARP